MIDLDPIDPMLHQGVSPKPLLIPDTMLCCGVLRCAVLCPVS